MGNIETGGTPPWEYMYDDYEPSPSKEEDATEPNQELSLGQKVTGFLNEMESKIEEKVVNFFANKYLDKYSDEEPSKVLKRQIRWNAVRSGTLAAASAVAVHYGVDASAAFGISMVGALAFESRQLFKAHTKIKGEGQE